MEKKKKKRIYVILMVFLLVIALGINFYFIIKNTNDYEKEKISEIEETERALSWADVSSKEEIGEKSDDPNYVNGVALSEGEGCVYDDEATTELPSADLVISTKDFLKKARTEIAKYKTPSESYKNVAEAFAVIRCEWGRKDGFSVNNPLFITLSKNVPQTTMDGTTFSIYSNTGECLSDFYEYLSSLGCNEYYLEYEIIDKLLELDEITEEEYEALSHYILTYI